MKKLMFALAILSICSVAMTDAIFRSRRNNVEYIDADGTREVVVNKKGCNSCNTCPSGENICKIRTVCKDVPYEEKCTRMVPETYYVTKYCKECQDICEGTSSRTYCPTKCGLPACKHCSRNGIVAESDDVIAEKKHKKHKKYNNDAAIVADNAADAV